MMPTISAHIDKDLKAKLTSKSHKQGKSVSDIVKQALNNVDFDKQEYTDVDDQSKTKEGETAPPVLEEISNLSDRVEEIEDALVEIGKAQLCLGEIITQQAVDQEKKRLDEIQREDAHRIHLHNLIIRALEETANKNLEECKGSHPRLSG